MKKRILDIIFYTCCLLLLIIVVCQVGILPWRFIYFRSGSMHPTYLPGDLAFVYVGSNIPVEMGDVVLFSANGEPTIHRIVDISNGMITTKGDANPEPDKNQITRVDGKLLFAIPKLGYAIDFFQTPFRILARWIQGSRS
jgi:signal peptidase I